jgi:hypothetical protein
MNYNPSINQQGFNERIDNEIARLQQMKEQIQKPVQQPTNFTQNFQITPTNSHTMRYANTIEDVSRESVYFDTPFFSKDMSVLWIKNAKGDIKTYELNEIVQKDEKDIQIEMLQAQINEMKGMIENARSNDEPTNEPVESKESTNVSVPRTSAKKSKESTRDI